MNTEEHDDLWQLLGKAKAPVSSPFFSRNVLRGIREGMQEDVGFSAWFRSYWHVVTATACSLILVGFLVMPAAEKQESATILLAEKVSQSSDYQVIINFDELLASEESSIWLEN